MEKESKLGRPLTHGYASHGRRTPEHRIWRVWSQMRQRCQNTNDQRYDYYGGRGIKVCERWDGLNGFVNFLADMGPRPEGFQLDRKDNDGDYCPENCRWVSRKEQNRNTRQALKVTYNGETKAVGEWAEQLGIPKNTLKSRLFRAGWSVERAFTTPVRSR